jgi:hypothetical protein
MPDEIIERNFPVSAPAHLRLMNIRGSVNIQPGDEDQIAVTAVKVLESGNGEDTLIEMKQEEDGRVIVKTHFAEDFLRHIFNKPTPCKVDYSVRVPPDCTLNISGVSNSTVIHGTSGEIDLESVNGSLTIEGATGRIELTTVSGDVSGDKLSGPSLRLKTVSGSVDLRHADFPAIEGNTVSGDVRIETPLGQGPYDFHSVSGDILLVVPEDTRCTVSVSGISAGLRSKLALTSEQRNTGNHHAEVMGGGVRVNLSTVSGSLILDTLSGKEVKIESAPASTPSRQEILDKIERGEMSVDEGIQALKS